MWTRSFPIQRFALRLRYVLVIPALGILAAGNSAHAQLGPALNPRLDHKEVRTLEETGIDQVQKDHPSQGKNAPHPSFSIPVTPLGFAAPAPFYLGDRFAQVSLDFLDEDTLLFTFRVPGLIAREHPEPGDPLETERHIRALTLSLPTGKVAAEGMWVLHDYRRYLWRMNSRNFLFRDKDSVQLGDAALHLEPFLRFPGTVNGLELDTSQSLLVANTTEPPAAETKAASPNSQGGALSAGPAAQPATASASVVSGHLDGDSKPSSQASQNLVRILHMDTRKVMLFSRVNGPVHIPLDGEGYYESLRGKSSDWLIEYNNFHGSAIPVGTVESSCEPSLEVLYPGMVLSTECAGSGGRHLTALLRNPDQNFKPAHEKDHSRLWDISLSPTRIWPLMAGSSNGLRLARATLEVTHPISPSAPLDPSDIRAQAVDVYDLATGKLRLTVPATPILDGGGNFALSPSGNRFAVLNDGAIQVFDLPPAPVIPVPTSPNGNAAKP